MSLLLPYQTFTVPSRAHRISFPNALVHSARCPSHRRRRRRRSLLLLAGCSSPQLRPPAMCLQKPFDISFKLPNPLPFLTVSSSWFLWVCGFLGILPSDFSDRWNYLVELSRGSEKKVKTLPYHLIQAVLASEDRRFFYHFGFDPYGIGRAVVFYPNGGGGSTITQQMYWGHGNYGIEAASLFYFGKHPPLLNMAESALLAGILPGPESLNPITNPKKGKDSQARALRRMVAAGFLDLEMALDIVRQPLRLFNNRDVEEVQK